MDDCTKILADLVEAQKTTTETILAVTQSFKLKLNALEERVKDLESELGEFEGK